MFRIEHKHDPGDVDCHGQYYMENPLEVLLQFWLGIGESPNALNWDWDGSKVETILGANAPSDMQPDFDHFWEKDNEWDQSDPQLCQQWLRKQRAVQKAMDLNREKTKELEPSVDSEDISKILEEPAPPEWKPQLQELLEKVQDMKDKNFKHAFSDIMNYGNLKWFLLIVIPVGLLIIRLMYLCCQSDYASQNDTLLKGLLDLENQLNKVNREARVSHKFKKRASKLSRGKEKSRKASGKEELGDKVQRVASDSESLGDKVRRVAERDRSE